ncbi:MAG TPA: OmpA family protein [Gemmatimonadaceae bacterium]|nr:OmpA family protein [Gemmatimonadaceae bacterium]
MSTHLRTLPFALAIAAAATLGVSNTADAQFGSLKDRIKQKAAEKAAEKVGKKVGEAMSDKPAADSAVAQPVVSTSNGSAAVSSAPVSRREWANYDFVPGARTIFYTDFSEDQVGNFPKRLTFKSGGMEVVELDGGQHVLKASSYSILLIPLPEVLPQKFTIELDVINRDSRGVAANTFEITGGGALNDTKYTRVGWGHNGLDVIGGGVEGMSIMAKDADVQRYVGQAATFRILGDGQALKLYADEKRLANIPNAGFQRGRTLALYLQGRDDEKNAVYVSRIRVAESNKDIYDELSASGRWTTQGILFQSGKSDLKPESTPTLKAIAAALKAHPDLKVEIQGHTDNVGSAASNLTLSQARADAVKAALEADFAISGDQLTAKGYGDTKPVTKNATPEGRANNRRVDIVKL